MFERIREDLRQVERLRHVERSLDPLARPRAVCRRRRGIGRAAPRAARDRRPALRREDTRRRRSIDVERLVEPPPSQMRLAEPGGDARGRMGRALRLEELDRRDRSVRLRAVDSSRPRVIPARSWSSATACGVVASARSRARRNAAPPRWRRATPRVRSPSDRVSSASALDRLRILRVRGGAVGVEEMRRRRPRRSRPRRPRERRYEAAARCRAFRSRFDIVS